MSKRTCCETSIARLSACPTIYMEYVSMKATLRAAIITAISKITARMFGGNIMTIKFKKSTRQECWRMQMGASLTGLHTT